MGAQPHLREMETADGAPQLVGNASESAYLIFRRLPGGKPLQIDGAPKDCAVEIWRPSLFQPSVQGLRAKSLFWTLCHWLKIFQNREYCILLIRRGGSLIHRVAIVPTHYRWPFASPSVAIPNAVEQVGLYALAIAIGAVVGALLIVAVKQPVALRNHWQNGLCLGQRNWVELINVFVIVCACARI